MLRYVLLLSLVVCLAPAGAGPPAVDGPSPPRPVRSCDLDLGGHWTPAPPAARPSWEQHHPAALGVYRVGPSRSSVLTPSRGTASPALLPADPYAYYAAGNISPLEREGERLLNRAARLLTGTAGEEDEDDTGLTLGFRGVRELRLRYRFVYP
jgi:hypothetical protein